MELDYDLKFEEMKKYIPFLESMIRRLENTTSGPVNPRQAQLSKIKALRDLLLDKSKRMKIENLLKCEQVLVNLYAKVESRETLPGIEKAPASLTASQPRRIQNDELNIARQKLKDTILTCGKSEYIDDTLPEIARANQAEVDCSPGSKEPALFQRRPNKFESSIVQENSLGSAKRNYTRVLISPPRSSSQRRWSSKDNSPEKLFQRRSPKKSPRKSPSSRKKEKKKYKKELSRNRKNSDNLNITLQVPEESLNSLRTEDIFERIINCDNTDVDIATLRELRSQIIGELNLTSANEDISDLILKSYKRNKKNKINNNVDVEEGELSDSESEAIENIYGSLVIVDSEVNAKKDSQVATITSKDKKTESRKIQICLVISNNEKEKSKEQSISGTSNKAPTTESTKTEEINISSENKVDEHFEEVIPKPKPETFDPNNFDLSSDYVPQCDPVIKTDSSVTESYKTTVMDDLQKLPRDAKNDESKTVKEPILNITNDQEKNNIIPTDEENKKIENKANFYKPIKDCHVPEKPESSEINAVTPNEYLKNTSDNETVPEIPFLSDPSPGGNAPQPSKEDKSVSEKDILLALKNEILSETIPIPGVENPTPSIHQPKILTKVSNAQEIVKKKKISIENYKKKSSLAKDKLFQRLVTDENSQKQSRGLTAKEYERFKLIGLGIDSDSSEEDDQNLLDEVYSDLAPQSPDVEFPSAKDCDSPVIIPDEPLNKPVAISATDIDMRVLMPTELPLDANKPKETQIDPRKRKEQFINNDITLQSGNSTPRPNFPNMTPNRTGSMTPNSRTFEMTPSYNFDQDDQIKSRKHVYAPRWGTREREHSVNGDNNVRWETSDRKSRWETRSTTDDPTSFDQNRYINRDTFSRRPRDPRLNPSRRDENFSRLECPATPSHYFGRGEYPTTPSHPFGRSDGSMTPVHPFGRSDLAPSKPCPPFGGGDTTPIHSFGRSEMPRTPSHPFGRSDYPTTPSHPFGRAEGPNTPSHPFGRTECPNTPSHSFGRVECPNTPSHPFGRSGISLDPRRQSDFGEDNRRGHHPSTYHRNDFYGSDKFTRESHERVTRESSVGRNELSRYAREQSAGARDRLRESSGGSQYRHDQPMRRELNVGSSNKSYVENRRNSDYYKDNLYRDKSKDNQNLAANRERSVGRTLPGDQSSCRSLDRKTVSVESHAGRSFTIDTSINTTFQAFKAKDIDDMFDSRRKRASSVGRSLVRERSILPEVISKLKDNRNRANFRRAQSVGRDLVEPISHRSFKDIKADFKSCKLPTFCQKSKNEKLYDKNYKTVRENKNAPRENKNLKNSGATSSKEIIKKLSHEAPKPQRHPRSRRERYEEQREDKSKNNTYSPRKNYRDPRICRASSISYKEPRSNSNDKQVAQTFGIVYTNDNIAKGNILGIGSGVKNYKIPKIKRPPEENLVKESENQIKQGNEGKEKNECLVKDACDRDTKKSKKPGNTKTKESIKKSGSHKPALRLSRSLSSDEDERQLTVKKTRKSKKPVLYDSESEDGNQKEKTKEKESTSKLVNKVNEIFEEVIPKPKIKENESTSKLINLSADNYEENNSLDFSFGIEDEDIDIFTDNIASDNVIDNINDLLANLDKDIDPSKSNEGIMTDVSRNSLFDNLFRNLTDNDSTKLFSNRTHSENNETKISQPVDNDAKTKLPEQSESLKYQNSINLNLQEDNSYNEVGSTSIPVEHNSKPFLANVIPNADANSDISSTPDSTINNEDNLNSYRLSHDTPDSTNNLQTDINCDITSTHDPNKQSRSNVTSEISCETVMPKADPYEEILSLLQDKSRVRKLLGNLDPNDERLKKKLEKLIEIVSDEEEDKETITTDKIESLGKKKVEDTEDKNKASASVLSKEVPVKDVTESEKNVFHSKAEEKVESTVNQELKTPLGLGNKDNESIVEKDIIVTQSTIHSNITDQIPHQSQKELPDENKEQLPDRDKEQLPDQDKGQLPDQDKEKLPDENKEQLSDQNKKQNKEQLPDQDKGQLPDQGKEKLPDENKEQLSEQNKKQLPEQNKEQLTDQDKGQLPDQYKEKLPDENKEQLSDQNKKLLPEQNKEQLSDQNKDQLTDQNKDLSPDQNKDLSTDQNKDLSIEQNKDLSTEQNKDLSPDQNKDLSLDENKDLSPDKNEEQSDTGETSEEDTEPVSLRSKQYSKKIIKKPKVVRKKQKVLTKTKPIINKKKVKKRVTRSSDKNNMTEITKNTQLVQDNKNHSKKKGRAKKSELLKLQEDIRDMFISNEVLNATGIRMCRLAKLANEKNPKDKSASSETSPIKSNESENKIEDEILLGQSTPVVVLEKKSLEIVAPKQGKKTSGKPSTVTTNIRKKPGPKSKTKSLETDVDPYEFESDSFSEITKTHSSPQNSDSDNESLMSSNSFTSTELLVELKPKNKRKKSSWQSGIIRSKKIKKKAPKPHQNIMDREQSLERDTSVTKPVKIPDMNCFTDINYCFLKGTISYGCRLCNFEGDAIVHHYKKHHPHYEIPLSRMLPQVAKDAINQSMVTNFKEMSKVSVTRYACKFCGMTFDDKRTVILEAFFWHVVSTHTGEYKQLCSECTNVKTCPFMLDIPPPPKDLKGLLMGYICGKCNYTQVSLENLKNHVSLRHNDDETEVFTISLSSMTKKIVDMLKIKADEDCTRSLRSRRTSNRTVLHSDTTESDDTPSNSEQDLRRNDSPIKLMTPSSVKSRINFETDVIRDTDVLTVVKSETDDSEDIQNNMNLHDSFDPPSNLEHTTIPETTRVQKSTKQNVKKQKPPRVFVQSHFKLSYTESDSKEYTCCINGDCHYRTSLLISLKKHVQIKNSQDIWDGFCAVCQVIVMPQGVHKFKECLIHMLDKHIDNFPILEGKESRIGEESVSTKDSVVTIPEPSKSYINVRPIAELLSDTTEHVQPPTLNDTHALPKIASVISLNSETSITEKSSLNTVEEISQMQPPAPKLNYEEAMRNVINNKHRIVLQAMMSRDKLAHVFKCAGRYCSFTCSSVENALLHASTHQRCGGADALSCAYCSFDASGNAIDLVSHVFKDHGVCMFACNLCFYRALNSPLVEAHYSRAHRLSKEIVVLQCAAPSSVDITNDEGLLSRTEAVKHYVCRSEFAGSCKFRTFTMPKIIQHYEEKHADDRYYSCSECSSFFTSPNDLVHHLKEHHLNMYQCTWCIFGADTEIDMLNHASINHPTKRPQAYLRQIIETRDQSSVPKFKVLPFIHITKQNTVKPLDVAVGSKTEDALKEAERALELEKLLGHISNATSNRPQENTPIATRDARVEQEEPTCIMTETAATSVVSLAPVRPEPPSVVPLAPVPVTSCNPAPANVTVKEEPDDNVSPEKAKNNVISLDSDEEDAVQAEPTPQVDNLTENNPGNRETLNPPVTRSTSVINVKVPWAQLFKCKNCLTIMKTGNLLKRHLSTCYPPASEHVSCGHCEMKCRKEYPETLLRHYLEYHAPLEKYTCGICKYTNVRREAIKKHVNMVHNVRNVSFRADSGDNEYVVEAAVEPATSKPRERRKRSSNEPAPVPSKQRRYGPDDITLLPINQIFDESTQCSLCEFSTKVRQNMIRHLQLHGERRAVPEIAPVNPVPHLETNEMHFDRMVNLASSSVASKNAERAEEEEVRQLVPAAVAARYPRYVPPRRRYTCGAHGCAYISIDEAMLQRHWETLHAACTDYRCAHCPPSQRLDTSRPLSAARVLAHLRMHAATLLACSQCAYYHYLPRVLDRHLAEKHPGGGGTSLVLREPAPSRQPPSVPAPPTMDLRAWQCGLCRYSTRLRPEVVDHCATVHHSKFQYKCAFCPWRSSTLENVTKHHSNSHPGRGGDVFYFYYREGDVPDDADGTPRWVRQGEVKREVDAPPPPQTPLPPPPTTADTVDLNIVKSEVDETTKKAKTTEELCRKFGEFCEPNGIKYKCSLCQLATEDTKEAMQSHLYEELQYRKWACRVCTYRAFHKQGLKEHAIREHRQNLEPIEMSSDYEKETWVEKLLEHQESVIRMSLANFQKQHIVTPEKQAPKQKDAAPPSEPGAGEVKYSMRELENAFGSFGTPCSMLFSCPKCEFKVKDEAIMYEHLEIELTKVRWRCSSCTDRFFQQYHEAQLHCKSAHAGASSAARPVEAQRGVAVRAAWRDAVLQVQRLTMRCMPPPPPDSVACPVPAVPAVPAPSPAADNSLLVVRYEQPVQVTEPSASYRRPRSPMDDSDDERLVIDEPARRTDKYHQPRHNTKPYGCAHCPFSGYGLAMERHIETHHPADRLIPTTDVFAGLLVCLTCRELFPNRAAGDHSHDDLKPEFAAYFDTIYECSVCHVYTKTFLRSINNHFASRHPNTDVSYTRRRVNYSKRMFYHCKASNCNRIFDNQLECVAHHNGLHGPSQNKFTKKEKVVFEAVGIDDEVEIGGGLKRKLEDAPDTISKRIAKKSTSKVAKKSTTKLPLGEDSGT